MSDNNIAIQVKGVSKNFRLPHDQHNGVKQLLLNIFKRNKKRGYETQNVLNGITFDIKKGEFFGIVGRNGSGKSTLLKIISEIYTPDKGFVHINGKLTPFIELGVGFNPELTGRENVYMNGALLGFSRKEMDSMYHEIVAFAELDRFMDQKLKNYSSGMQVRLAFSIAIRADTDILVLDEVLAVGDEAFQRKCYQYFAKLKKDKKTVILVTHDMDSVKRFCSKALMLHDGEIIAIGSVKSVADKYTQANADSIIQEAEQVATNTKTKINKFADVQVTLRDSEGKKKKIFRNNIEDKTLNIEATVTIKENIDKKSFISLLIKNANGEAIARFSSEETPGAAKMLYRPRKKDKIVISSEVQNIFGEGDYSIAVSFKSVDRTASYIESVDKATFTVAGLGKGKNGFALRPNNTTSFSKV